MSVSLSRTGIRTRNNDKVTATVEDYLVTIYRLEEAFGVARTTVIARELGVKPGTVSKVVGKLEVRGLVERTKYYGVKLTDKGREIAERIIWKHRVLERFLYDYVGLDPLKAHEYAHMMEHLPDEIVKKIYDRLGRPATCPLGNPIPGAEVPDELKVAVPLIKAEPGACVKVVRIAGVLREGLKHIIDLGLMIGVTARIVYVSNSHVVLKPISASKCMEIPYEYARMVYVVVDEDNC